MAGYFLDTSALAKLYRKELGSDSMDRILALPSSQFLISRLAIVELESVFARKVRAGEIDQQAHSVVRRRLRADLGRRRFLVASVKDDHLRFASHLLAQYGVIEDLRTLDAVHLSVAVGLRRAGLAAVFVAADQRLCRVAALEGFTITNPEQPAALVI